MDTWTGSFRRTLSVVGAIASLLVSSSAVFAVRLPEHRFTTADGLASDMITDITQDDQGFLWVATEEGVSRFDGVTFRSYGMRDGLPYPGVDSIREDAVKRLWAGTRGGLCWFDLKQHGIRGRWHRVALPGGRLGNHIIVVRSDLDGNLWAASPTLLFVHRRGAPVSEFHEVKFPSAKNESIPPLTIYDLALGKGGAVWISTSRGLFRRFQDGDLARVRLHRQGAPRILGTGMMTVAPNGDLWIAASGGRLLRVEEAKGGGRALPPEQVLRPRVVSIPLPPGHHAWRLTGLTELRGVLWVATPRGLCSVKNGESKCMGQGRLPTALSSLAHDSVGNLWIGTESQGLIRLTDDGLTSYGPEDGLAAEREAELFFGPHNEPCEMAGKPNIFLACFDGHRFQSFPLVLPRGVKHDSWGWNQLLARDRPGSWWLGTFSGVVHYRNIVNLSDFTHPREYRIITSSEGLPDDHVFRVAIDHRGWVWVGTINPSYLPGGLAVIDPASETAHEVPGASTLLDHDAATALLDDGRGFLWIGTYSGKLLRYSFSTRALAPAPGWPRQAGLVWDLHLDRDHRLWVATSSLGVVRVTNADTLHPSFVAFGENQGLASNRIRCIAEGEQGSLYFGTGNGVDRYDPDSGRVRHLGTADGLPNGTVEVCRRGPNGYLWFGTLDGLARLDPRKVRSQCEPRVDFERFSAGGVRHAIEGSRPSLVRLGTGERDIEVSYVGACLAAGDTLRYQHRLIGLVDQWSRPSSNRLVTYAELAPGTYRFEVRAVNAEGETSDQLASLPFEIPPPWWRRSWFLAALALLVASLSYGGYRLRLERLLEAERLRTRIATDLHDELGSGLSRISILSEVVQRELTPEGRRQRLRLEEIGSSARDLLEATSDMVWSIDPRRDDLASLLARLRRFGSELCESAGVHWRLEAPQGAAEIRLGTEKRRHLLLILKEALNNAIRHGRPASVSIKIEVRNGRRLVAEVRDDGCGFDPAEIAERTSSWQGYGLSSMDERARILGGKLAVDSRKGSGTRVSLSIPLARQRSRRGA